ncbi:3-oxoacyl-[acyl-carrier-protein] synthase 2 [Actinoplanes sp. NBRC 14428]|nr:3-oxoacyl-[acyl-carrier-protein] synthase 2 [Actinoplanes sp. NBRC 14428]
MTGCGAVTPLGVGATALHERAVAGDTGLDTGVGRCAGFDPAAWLSRRDLRRTDRYCQLAVAAADEAVRQAGWDAGLPYPGDRIACIIGSALGGITTTEEQSAVLATRGAGHVSPLLTAMVMGNAAAAHVAMRYGLRGESAGFASACSSGSQSVGAGLRLVRAGAADAVVVGGAESAVSPLIHATFRNAGVLSESGRTAPFDRRRDGFLLGEGAGVLVLEEAGAAAARGAPALAEVLGYGATSDAYHLTAPEPEATGAAAAVRAALSDAAVGPGDLGYINAHGTGTVLNDRAEVTALRRVLGEHLAGTPMSSSKSYLGHLLGAAGAVEAVATVRALQSATAPPTAGLDDPDEDLGPLDLIRAGRTLKAGPAGLVALSTSFGFGGHNAALVLAEAR